MQKRFSQGEILCSPQLCYNTIMPNQFTNSWTLQELNFLKENIHKLTYKQMADFINRSPTAIQSKIRYLPFQQKVKKHPVNSIFFKKWTPNMAYVLGFIAADGNICHSGRVHAIQIACDDEDVIVKIKKVLSYQDPIYRKFRKNGKTSYSLRICDPIIFHDLQKLNITERKSLTLIPPKIPKSLTRHFLRGYFDGDGSVSLRKANFPSRLVVNIYTASEKMALFLHNTLSQLSKGSYKGRVGVTLGNQKTVYYAVRLGTKTSIQLFRFMYKDSENLYMERKHQKFIEGISYGN